MKYQHFLIILLSVATLYAWDSIKRTQASARWLVDRWDIKGDSRRVLFLFQTLGTRQTNGDSAKSIHYSAICI